MRPTLFSAMSQSSLRSILIINNGWGSHWLRLQVRKRELSNRAFRLFALHSQQKPKQSFERERPSATRRCNSYTKFTTTHRLVYMANSKNRMRLLRSPQLRPRISTSMKKQLFAALRRSNGPLVFKNGTSAPSSTARIILLPRVRSPKRGRKFLVIRRRRSCSRFFPTKICVVSAKRSRRLLRQFSSRKFAVSGRQHRGNWRKSWRAFLLSVGQAHRLPATDAVALQFPSRHL